MLAYPEGVVATGVGDGWVEPELDWPQPIIVTAPKIVATCNNVFISSPFKKALGISCTLLLQKTGQNNFGLLRGKSAPMIFDHMTIHPLPPQAYTKDTLLKAFSWLQNQGDSIKAIATSPDILVSLYMKAQMQGEEALHRPSIKNFQNDLKNLASVVGDWEQNTYQDLPPAPRPQFHSSTASSATTQYSVQMKSTHSMNQPSPTPVASPTGMTDHLGIELDVKIQAYLKEVQSSFNLSSEQEALRFLVTLGYHRAKGLLS